MRVFLHRQLPATLLLIAAASPAPAQDWTNAGGNQGRNGRTTQLGPDAPGPALWSGGRSSIIAWQPVIAGRSVFVVRQTGFPPESTASPVVAMSLDDGRELWHADLPANPNDWTAWIAGVSLGASGVRQVYASRSGNGASISAKLYAIDAATGAMRWPTGSQDLIDAGPYDGVVFADNGDPVIASFRTIKRIRASDGTTMWSVARVASVSGNCGGAIRGNAIYIADTVAGGQAIKKFNLTTGAFMYQSTVMAGFLIQNTPMVSPDGTIYLSRVQNNQNVDFFFAINDSGSAMTIRWFKPAGYSTSSEFAVANDNSVYMWAPGNFLQRRSAADGTLLNQTAATIPADFAAPRLAVDSAGRVFFSNGAFGNGRSYSFNEDLTQRWSLPVPNINIGAPAIGADGTLVIAGVGTNIFALRTTREPPCIGDFNQDGGVDGQDVEAFFHVWEAGSDTGDVNQDGGVDGQDVAFFFLRWEAGC